MKYRSEVSTVQYYKKYWEEGETEGKQGTRKENRNQTECVTTDPGKAIRDLLKENNTVESKPRTNRR